MSAKPKLRLVKAEESEPTEDYCGWCAFIVVFLFMGCLWWPLFAWFYKERLWP